MFDLENPSDKYSKNSSLLQEYQSLIPIIKRQIRMVENGYCQRAVWNHQPELSEYINNIFYINSEYHDVFRIGDYPEDVLYSYEECLEYIKQYELKHNIIVDVYRLKEFWDKYPDGIITFG